MAFRVQLPAGSVMSNRPLQRGDEVILRGTVSKVGHNLYDFSAEVSVRVYGLHHSISLSPDYLERVEKPSRRVGPEDPFTPDLPASELPDQPPADKPA